MKKIHTVSLSEVELCVSPMSSRTASKFTAVLLAQRCHTGAYIALLCSQFSPLHPAGASVCVFNAATCLDFRMLLAKQCMLKMV